MLSTNPRQPQLSSLFSAGIGGGRQSRVMTFRLFLVSIAALATATTAAAAEKASAIEPHLRSEFDLTDTNHNGVLSEAEVRARIARMGAGAARLTPAQASTFAHRLFARADADRNGGVTPAEFQTAFRATARRYDTNGDGVVSVAERERARAALSSAASGR